LLTGLFQINSLRLRFGTWCTPLASRQYSTLPFWGIAQSQLVLFGSLAQVPAQFEVVGNAQYFSQFKAFNRRNDATSKSFSTAPSMMV
jgi:hypothetical protein